MRSSGSSASWGRASRMYLREPRCCAFADGHVAVFLAFALAHYDQPTVKLKIEQFQIHHFDASQSGGVDHFQDCAIAQAQRVGEIRLQHHLLDLRHGEDVFGQRAAQARQIDLRCRVVQDVVLPRHPAEPHARWSLRVPLPTHPHRSPPHSHPPPRISPSGSHRAILEGS